jgi:predicted nucleic acid-binding protein
MSVLVVDASVAVKWILPEPLFREAVRLQSPSYELHAPSFLEVELASVLWKKIRQGLLGRAEADPLLSRFLALPFTRHADNLLLATAFDLAERTGRTVYDCLYLALASRLGARLVTADERLVNSLTNTPWSGSALHLRDVP